MKKITRIIIAILTALSLICFAACGSESTEKPTAQKSKLIGTFTYQETVGDSAASPLVVVHEASIIRPGDRSYMLSTVFPLNSGLAWQRISYNIDQRLMLKRDYTYDYEYTIVLGNPGDWGGRFGQITVNMKGEYTYEEIADELYSVTLSDPTDGSQTVRSFHIAYVGVYGLSMHNEDDLVLDYSYLSGLNGYKFDEYSRGRTVRVDKSEDAQRQFTDNVFYTGLFDYVAHYATY